MATENILDLHTRVDRPRFTIDDESCEMVHPNELSMADFHLLSKRGSDLINFGEQYEDDPDAAFEKIQKCMDGLIDIIAPDLPPSIRKKLNPFHVQQLLDSFIGLSRTQDKPGEPPNPAKSLQDSSASMAEVRKAG